MKRAGAQMVQAGQNIKGAGKKGKGQGKGICSAGHRKKGFLLGPAKKG